jgi:parallel beta-helix repeat protein
MPSRTATALYVLLGLVSSVVAHAQCGQGTAERSLSVKAFGAVGNGIANDTAAIQAALQHGGGVSIPRGTYLISVSAEGLKVPSNTALIFDEGAVLKASPSNSEFFTILGLESVQNVTIIGGVLEGERWSHLGSSGEWGMGLRIKNSKFITVCGLIARANWGDGIYIGGNDSAHISLFSVHAQNNRRNGLTIVAGTNILIQQSEFSNTDGTPPEAGLDIEPNPGDRAVEVRVENSTFINNKRYGILLSASGSPNDPRRGLNAQNTVKYNYVSQSEVGIRVQYDGHTIENNTIEGTPLYGIHLWNSSAAAVEHNIIDDAGIGILLEGSERSRVEANIIQRASRIGIYVGILSDRNTIKKNQCIGPGLKLDHLSGENYYQENLGC